MKKLALVVVGLLVGLFLFASPASAGLGGVKYFSVTGSVNASTGQITWNLHNAWHAYAETSSVRLGAVEAPMLTDTQVVDPTLLAPGQCATLTVGGYWLGIGHPGLRGNLSSTVCN